MSDSESEITLKVSGSKEQVELFICKLKLLFPSMLKSNFIHNDKSVGVHCFINLNPKDVAP